MENNAYVLYNGYELNYYDYYMDIVSYANNRVKYIKGYIPS